MFSSEQVFKVSGEMDQLEMAIDFAINMYGPRKRVTYQITNDGKYCLGWNSDEEDGWKELPFDFNAHIVAEIVKQHLEKQDVENPYDWGYDGSSEKGFLMKAIDRVFSDEWRGIKKPFYGIVSIEPYYNYYAK